MKVTGLMIGDWVKMKGRQGYDRVRRIGMDENKQWYISFICIDLFRVYEFEPIPLTPEILEKNRFSGSKGPIWRDFEFKVHKEEKDILINYESNHERLRIIEKFTTCLLIDIKYVHQFQHALRLCGLDELADNFKV